MISKIRAVVSEVSNTKFFSPEGDRALVEVSSEALLLILAVGLVGGLGYTLTGVTDDIFPGPDGEIEMTQEGERVVLTVDNLDSDVGELDVSVTNESSERTELEPDLDAEAGDSAIITDVKEDDIITVVAHEDQGDGSNQIARMTVGPTGSD